MSADGNEKAGSDEEEDEVDDGQAVRFWRMDAIFYLIRTGITNLITH